MKIQDLNAPEVEIFTGLNEKQLRRLYEPEEGVFVCESIKVIDRAINAGYEPLSFFVEESRLEDVRPLVENPSVPLFEATYEVMRDITGYAISGGVLAAMRRKPAPKLDVFLRDKKNLVVMDDVENPTNAGAIFRSAAALGADGVLLTKGCADPLYRRAARVSMGTVFAVDWTYMLAEDIREIKKAGFGLIALALSERSKPLGKPDLRGNEKRAIVLGNEDHGISEEILSECDHMVEIPMRNGVDSLNVAAACAVACWELFNAPRG